MREIFFDNHTRRGVGRTCQFSRVGKQAFAEGENVRNRGFLKSEPEASKLRSNLEEGERLRIPYHLGVILDGNRRWALEKGLPAMEGHRRGAKKLEELIKWTRKRGIKILTLFVFSTENWMRPKNEVGFLMGLVKKMVNDKLKKLHREKIKIRVIGQKDKLSPEIQRDIEKAEKITKDNQAMTVNFALSYGGRAEIVEAIKNIVKNKISPEKINEETISQNLWTSDLDLLIRTGKEQRISNFLIWQAAYSELYFCQKYWPEFTEKDLQEALDDYSRRRRRFGG